MKTIQKVLHSLGHGRISALHPECIHNRQRNAINRSEKRNLDSIYQCRYGSCHHLVIRRLKILQSPHKTNKCAKNTKACKNIRSHLQKTLVNMNIHIINVHEVLHLSNSFFCPADAVDKIIHLLIQIFVAKKPP